MVAPPIEPVHRARAHEQILSQLSELIENGELQPGDRLPSEREMARSFGVGRPTLRQALSVLSSLGVLEIRPGSGIYLRTSFRDGPGTTGQVLALMLMAEKHDLMHIQELRMAVEGSAAYLGAQRRTPAQLRELEEVFDSLCDAFTHRGVAFKEDFQFHAKIAEATANPVLLKVMVALADIFLQQFEQVTRPLYPKADRVETGLCEHRAILEAVRTQRADDAREAAIRHLTRVGECLKQAEQLQADRLN